MFPWLQLPQHSAYDDTFFWSGECHDNEVLFYLLYTKPTSPCLIQEIDLNKVLNIEQTNDHTKMEQKTKDPF